MENKTVDEVKDYSEVFWKNYKIISDYEKILANIERGESKLKKIQEVEDALRTKIERYSDPISDLTLNYGQSKGKQFTEEEDRFMVRNVVVAAKLAFIILLYIFVVLACLSGKVWLFP